MTALTLRPGTPRDAASCADILNAWIDATDWMPRCHPPDDVEGYHRDVVLPERAVTVADSAGRVTGFCAVDSGTAFITALYLDAGARLLDHVKARAEGTLTLWTFVANTGARRFYEREGFREVRRTEGDNEEGLPDILYRWDRA